VSKTGRWRWRGQMTVAKKVAGEPYDAVDWIRSIITSAMPGPMPLRGGGNAYGLSDLNYYGSFICGGASFWSLFLWRGMESLRRWSVGMYPGRATRGCRRIRGDGWPYHWVRGRFPGYGMGWQPGGSWNGLNNVGMNGGTLRRDDAEGTLRRMEWVRIRCIRRSVLPPAQRLRRRERRAVAGDVEPNAYCLFATGQSGICGFRKDSAGGCVRGDRWDLNHVNNDVESMGSASMPVYALPNGGAEPTSTGDARTGDRCAGERGEGCRECVGMSSRRRQADGKNGWVQGSSPSYHGVEAVLSPRCSGSDERTCGNAGAGGGGGSRGPVASPK